MKITGLVDEPVIFLYFRKVNSANLSGGMEQANRP
jgi:hypothetical protein